MRDPRWCDGWSNVNGVRRFGRPKLVVVATTPKCQRSRTGHRHPPLVPSPTAVLYVSCNCRACCSSGHSSRGQWGQTRETQDGRSPCTADGPAPSSNPHQHRLIASFGGTVHQQKLKAWLKRAKKGNRLRLSSSEDGTLKGSRSLAPKKRKHWTSNRSLKSSAMSRLGLFLAGSLLLILLKVCAHFQLNLHKLCWTCIASK